MKDEKPFVNIIILNWNNYEDTKECLESINKIDYVNWGITLIDNNSTDGSAEKLVLFCKNNKKIKILLNNKNLGFARANNIAMKKDLFNSDYFLLLNNDVVVDKNFLKELVNKIEKNKKIGVVAPAIYKYSNKKQLNKINYPAMFNFKRGGGRAIFYNENAISPIKVDYASGCCWLIKREIIEKTKWFKEKYFAYNEEIEWAYRINQLGYNFLIIPSAKIYHKGERTSSKISGFKLYYSTRNMIWFEREYALTIDLIIFYSYLFIYKILKTLIKIIFGKTKWINLKSYFKGIKEGLFNSYN